MCVCARTRVEQEKNRIKYTIRVLGVVGEPVNGGAGGGTRMPTTGAAAAAATAARTAVAEARGARACVSRKAW